ncbi:LLM class flavin-dependent oxidoreductase [Streptomyces sp. ADMS]|uniref:LLM class flavin-dependent oxidoreductase n=1 Tax=Streptomyces sp. ADMS TaxID=3071415 RepID=UPI00296EBC88|nr:LLM class flavin-dependent oxidoreductase [Streptomyces sp. ADMS]MDW4905896.1 LLM class flavin-dependent oxidoreductase [Streptomyces sp. ADMS]
MRLGVNLMAHSAATMAPEAERLGYSTALAPEGLHDAVSVLGLAAGRTERLTLMSGVCQIPARQPVLAAMTAATLAKLSDGRFRLGLGISNEHTTRNWYGAPFGRPLARTREYVTVVRTALRGDEVRYRGEHFALPLGEESAGFRLASGGVEVPLDLAAVGPRNLRLAGEIADGWLGVFCSPEQLAVAVPELAAGRQLAGRTMDGFEVTLTLPLALGDDVATLARPIRGYVARFLSLGHRRANYYYRLAESMGYGTEAARVQDLYTAGDPAAAAAAVPLEFIEATALIGPAERIADRLKAYAAAGATTLCVGSVAPTIDAQVAMLGEAMDVLRSMGV